MTDLTTPTLPLDLIHAHPDNPRRNAVADDEMVDSIRAVGIAQAVTVMPNLEPCPVHPNVDCFKLGAGHRRCDGAAKGGLTEVPVVLREDLVTRAQQIAFMLVENFHRSDLTEGEVVDTFEQMTLEGFGPEDIAQLTGRSVASVKARLKLTRLAGPARERLVAGEMTLVDAETMLEFADDPKATAELEEALGTDNFQHTVYTVRGRRERAARRATMITEFEAAGARLATSVAGAPGLVLVDGVEHRGVHGMHNFPDELRSPESHDGCLAYVLPDYDYADPYLVCIDRSKHPQPAAKAAPGPSMSEWEKQQAARAEHRARREASMAARIVWLRDHFTGMFPARMNAVFSPAARAFLPLVIVDHREVPDQEVLLAALDAVPEDHSYNSLFAARQQAAAALAGQKPTQVLATFAAYLAALVAEQLDPVEEPQLIDDVVEVACVLALWDWAKGAGYPLSDVDKALVTALEVRHTELANEAEAAAS